MEKRGIRGSITNPVSAEVKRVLDITASKLESDKA